MIELQSHIMVRMYKQMINTHDTHSFIRGEKNERRDVEKKKQFRKNYDRGKSNGTLEQQ